jgi:hypothetical protein
LAIKGGSRLAAAAVTVPALARIEAMTRSIWAVSDMLHSSPALGRGKCARFSERFLARPQIVLVRGNAMPAFGVTASAGPSR